MQPGWQAPAATSTKSEADGAPFAEMEPLKAWVAQGLDELSQQRQLDDVEVVP